LLKAHQFRIGVESTCVCEGGHGIDDVYHFFLQCTLYDDLWRELEYEVKKVGEENQKNSRFNLSVPLLPAPYSDNQLSLQECDRILSATFRYIKKSQHKL